MGGYSQEVDAYIRSAEGVRQQKLQAIRALVHVLVPDAEERISWRMPTFSLPGGGTIIQMAAFKGHIGLYPEPLAIEAFKAELAGFHTSKGAIQLSLEGDLPMALIESIIRYRLAQLKTKT